MQWRMVARPENELLTCAAGASSIDASAQIVFTLPKASFMFFRAKIVGVTTQDAQHDERLEESKPLRSPMRAEELPYDRDRRLMVGMPEAQFSQELYFYRLIRSLHFEPGKDAVFPAERNVLWQSIRRQPVIHIHVNARHVEIFFAPA